MIRLIIGLGNPGRRYRMTRHNIGFLVVEEVARRCGAEETIERADCLMSRVELGGGALVLARPVLMMNRSGPAVRSLMGRLDACLAEVLVVCDDLHLDFGVLRLRRGGSHGGHNGLRSIIGRIGEEFSRLRIGVGRGDERRDLADHVLSRFEADEAPEVANIITRSAEAAETFITLGIAAVMNGFNGGDPATTE